ncbi:MAG: NUDIX domain-containing protein [Clostridia bacterium]|nr:NUDIX domain-containing protein [Clostridia bacterium]
MIERWDILNSNGEPTGRTVVRGDGVLAPGEYHLVVHIWVLSKDGKYLIQRRSDDKKLMPGEWAATGGAAVAGENSFEAAARELYEELGISSTPETLTLLSRIKRRNSILDIWVITVDLPVTELHLQQSEVAEASWVTYNKLKEMIATGKFHQYGNDYFDTVFSGILTYRGANI